MGLVTAMARAETWEGIVQARFNINLLTLADWTPQIKELIYS
jgi:hypothetical protein